MQQRLIRRPFKGTFFYEWQVGPLVLQARHADIDKPRFLVWHDRLWR